MQYIWQHAQFREQRYAAIALAGVKRYRPFQDDSSLTIYQSMIEQGAWWNITDGLAKRLGELLIDHPATTKRQMQRWSELPNLWLRRSAIICQLALKSHTDTDLLFSNIYNNINDRDFLFAKPSAEHYEIMQKPTSRRSSISYKNMINN